MMQAILTDQTHTIYTLDFDLSYSKLLALWNLSNPSYSALFLEKNLLSTGPHCSDPHSCRGNTLDVLIMFVVMIIALGLSCT